MPVRYLTIPKFSAEYGYTGEAGSPNLFDGTRQRRKKVTVE